MGIITLALVTAGEIDTFEVPFWVAPPPRPRSAPARMREDSSPERWDGDHPADAGRWVLRADRGLGRHGDDRPSPSRCRRRTSRRPRSWASARPAGSLRGAFGASPATSSSRDRHPAGRRRGSAVLPPGCRPRLGRDRCPAPARSPWAAAARGAGWWRSPSCIEHGIRRRDGRPGGAAGDGPRTRRLAVGAAVDDLRLHPGAGVADPAGRLARGPVRPPPVFQVGEAWFAVASLVCGLAQTTGHSGLAGPAGDRRCAADPGQRLSRSSFRPGDRAKAIGMWSALAGIAGLIGPFLGGGAGRRSQLAPGVPGLNVPVAVLILAVSGRHVPESRDPAEHAGSTISARRSARWRSAE